MKIGESSSSDPKWRLFESVHISTHIIYAVLTEKALNPFVECASGLLSGEGFSITLKFGCKRSIEHIQSLSELPSLAKKPVEKPDHRHCPLLRTCVPTPWVALDALPPPAIVPDGVAGLPDCWAFATMTPPKSHW